MPPILSTNQGTGPAYTELTNQGTGPAYTELIRDELGRAVNHLVASLPPSVSLSANERRGIIARYSSVLEGNFVYWMTGASLAAKSREAQAIIRDNLLEEVRDCHPGMLRNFAMAAQAAPSDSDALAVYANLSKVRLFIGRLSPVPIVAMMAFFEDFIQRFMPYLAELAQQQGSAEFEYTDVHSVCDSQHSQALFYALETEMTLLREPPANLLEGVHLLEALLQNIFTSDRIAKAATTAG